jgi:hypothetical protein
VLQFKTLMPSAVMGVVFKPPAQIARRGRIENARSSPFHKFAD